MISFKPTKTYQSLYQTTAQLETPEINDCWTLLDVVKRQQHLHSRARGVHVCKKHVCMCSCTKSKPVLG